MEKCRIIALHAKSDRKHSSGRLTAAVWDTKQRFGACEHILKGRMRHIPRAPHSSAVSFLTAQGRGAWALLCPQHIHPSLLRQFPKILLAAVPLTPSTAAPRQKQLYKILPEEPSQQPSCSAAEPLLSASPSLWGQTKTGKSSPGATQVRVGALPAPRPRSGADTRPRPRPQHRQHLGQQLGPRLARPRRAPGRGGPGAGQRLRGAGAP